MSKNLRLYNFLMFTLGMVMLVLGPILDFVMRDWGLNKAAAGLLSMTYMVGNVPGMLLSTKKLDPGTVRTACFLLAFALGLMALAPGAWVFGLGFFIAGFAAGFLFSGLAALATCAVADEEKGASLNRLYGWFALGVVIGPIYSSLWQSWNLWRPVPASYGLLLLVCAILFPHSENCQVPPRRQGKLPGEPQFWLICFALFFYVGAESVINTWVVKFLLDQFQLSWSNFVLVGLWINISVGRFILAKIGQRFDSLALVIGLSIWSGLFIFLAAFSSVKVSVFSFLAVGFGFSGIYSLLVERGASIAGEESIGILGTSGVLGAAITAALAGYIAERWSFPWGIALGAFLTLGIIIAVILSHGFSKDQKIGEMADG